MVRSPKAVFFAVISAFVFFCTCKISLAEVVLSRHSFSLVTYNIRWGDLGIAHVAETLKKLNPDFAFLQEVHGPPFINNWIDQAEYLGKALDMEYFFGKSTLWVSGEYGLAILSRYPLTEKKVYFLPTLEHEQQEILLQARAQTPAGPIMLYSTHLISSTHGKGNRAFPLRMKQAQFILSTILEQKDPVIFGADLNSFGASRIKRLFSKHMIDLFKEVGKGRNSTFPATFPILRLDYLYLRGPFHPWQSRVIQSIASDHRPLWGKVELTHQMVADPLLNGN